MEGFFKRSGNKITLYLKKGESLVAEVGKTRLEDFLQRQDLEERI